MSPFPPLVRRLIAGQLFIGVSNGLVMPSWFLYLDQVRGFGPEAAGLSFTLRAIGMIALAPLAGSLTDRRGPRGVVLSGTVCTVAGALGLGLSSWLGPSLAASFLTGAGVAFTGPSTRTVLLDSVPARQRARAATASFMMWNLGLGGGSLAGGLIASARRPGSFFVLFGLMALLGVLTRLVNLPAMPRRGGAAGAGRGDGPVRRAPLTGAFACYLVLATALQFAGYGQTTSGLPGLATTSLGVSTRMVGIALAINTCVILLTSPLTRRVLRGESSRARTLGMVAGLWALCWGLVIAGAALHVATAAILGFYALFGIGEVLLAASASPLVAELAPVGALGRYLGMDTFTRQLGSALGPVMSGALIAGHAYLAYPAVCAVICLLALATAPALGRLTGRPVSPAAGRQLAEIEAESGATDQRPSATSLGVVPHNGARYRGGFASGISSGAVKNRLTYGIRLTRYSARGDKSCAGNRRGLHDDIRQCAIGVWRDVKSPAHGRLLTSAKGTGDTPRPLEGQR